LDIIWEEDGSETAGLDSDNEKVLVEVQTKTEVNVRMEREYKLAYLWVEGWRARLRKGKWIVEEGRRFG